MLLYFFPKDFYFEQEDITGYFMDLMSKFNGPKMNYNKTYGAEQRSTASFRQQAHLKPYRFSFVRFLDSCIAYHLYGALY